jgi:hypothetical protein
VRIHTSIVAAIVTLAFAGPAVAGIQSGPYIGTLPTAGSASATQTQTQAGQSFVSSSVHVGTSAISGDCVLTTSDDHLWSYDCPGGGTVSSNTTAQGVSTAAGSCTLAVATAHFWTYSCSDGKAGMSKGAIPTSCKSTLHTGYLAIFSCPSSALSSTSTTVKAASPKAKSGTSTGSLRSCAGTLTDRRLSGLLCIL